MQPAEQDGRHPGNTCKGTLPASDSHVAEIHKQEKCKYIRVHTNTHMYSTKVKCDQNESLTGRTRQPNTSAEKQKETMLKE